ncbi:MAG: rhodanese-like domain-containing protein [Bacteroidetes bacterium]|nr:rhodanese-like domain-containing protein [Bacteroidota bacterium]MDA1120487.1 rhodanese-like domain-containing protein [Bacteroidota bacterium]
MLQTFKKLFSTSPSPNYLQLVKEGAVILDVRSRGEFSQGSIKGSINIGVNELNSNLHRLKDKSQPIITCCASGMRSASAKNILKSKGYTAVYNGGSWTGLQTIITT